MYGTRLILSNVWVSGNNVCLQLAVKVCVCPADTPAVHATTCRGPSRVSRKFFKSDLSSPLLGGSPLDNNKHVAQTLHAQPRVCDQWLWRVAVPVMLVASCLPLAFLCREASNEAASPPRLSCSSTRDDPILSCTSWTVF